MVYISQGGFFSAVMFFCKLGALEFKHVYKGVFACVCMRKEHRSRSPVHFAMTYVHPLLQNCSVITDLLNRCF